LKKIKTPMMKNTCILLTLIGLFTFNSTVTAQTAVNFTEEDCNGNSYTLFDELDAGKIIVIESHPGRIEFYLTDDYANTSCSSVSNWGNANNMANHIAFSSEEINMSDYGVDGMPKVVVLGGNSHEVLYNKNNGNISEEGVKAAISSALTLSIPETYNNLQSLAIFPNPSKGLISVEFFLENDSNLELYSILGKKMSSIDLSSFTANKKAIIDLDLSKYAKGNYLIKLNSSNRKETRLIQLK
jgi:hypothetical protein